jgi:signal transduction histidine kinase
MSGETFSFSDINELPSEAKAEKDFFLNEALKSTIRIPMIVEGKILGVLMFDSYRAKKTWPNDLVQQLQLIGQTFTYSLERRHTEDELRNSEERFRSFMDSATEGFILWDSDLNLIEVNDAAIKLALYEENVEDILGKNILEIVSGLKETGRYDQYLNVIKSGEPLFLSDLIPHPKFLEQYLNVKAFKVGEGLGMIVEDITERKRTMEIMIQTEKMMSVGGLAAGMAHEINNPLGGILQNVQVMKNRMFGDMPKNISTAEECGTTMEAIGAYMDKRNIFGMIDSVMDSGKRAAKIVDNMLSFSRKSGSQSGAHDLGELLDKALELAESDYDLKKKFDFRQIEISREYDDSVPNITCEPSQIQQVFLNILKNGSQAMVESKVEKQTPRFILRLKREGGMVRVEIEDNGPGMDEITRKRIFEPFYTTKPVGAGTGLGLSVSYFIITENHSGTMEVKSSTGMGAKFIIRLPIERKVH